MKKVRFTKKGAIFLFVFFGIGSIFFLINSKISHKRSNVTVKDFPKDTKSIELLLPVNGLRAYEPTKSRVSLLVSIPESFCSVYSLVHVMEASMSEFIPKTDKDVNSWTEIITVNKFLGNRLKASQATDHLKQAISRGG